MRGKGKGRERGERKGGRRGEGREGREREGGRRVRLPLSKFLDPPLRRNIAENFNRLSRVHERYRQTTDDRQTDGRTTTYSEHEHEFTFANKLSLTVCVSPTQTLHVVRSVQAAVIT